MEKRPLGLPDLLVSGSWYAIPAIWAFFAFVRMALGLGDKFLIACLVGTAAVFVWFIGQTLLQWGRAGKQPTDEQQRAAIGAMWGPVFSVIWAGFVAGCSASMIVVIELNDPFSKEAVDRVVQEHPILYWAVAGAGLVIGAGGRLWTLASPSRVVTSQREADAVVSEARKDELQTRPDGDEAGRTSR